MRFISFQAINFKGVADATIELGDRNSANIITLVGLNESGKTTLLEAIYSFSPDLESKPLLAQGIMREDFADLIPKHRIADFTGKVQIVAHVALDAKDKEELEKFSAQKGFLLDTSKLPNTFKITRSHRYELSQHIESQTTWSIQFPVKTRKQKNFSNAQGELWQEFVRVLQGRLPVITYYPTFIFDFPSKIYLSGSEKDKRNNFYKVLFQDILDFQGGGFDIDKHIISRVRREDQPSSWVEFMANFFASSANHQIQAVMDKVGATISQVVFEKWNEIFPDKIRGKEIGVEWKPEISEDGETRNVYVEFFVKDGTNRYEISERSLGFRWFFCFLLFTQFRASRKTDRGTIFIFDEPASNLHAKAQGQLLDSFPKISGGRNTLIYSTHSHYMINPQWLEQAYIVENEAVNYAKLETSSADYKKHTQIHAIRYRKFVGEHPDQMTYFQPILDKLDYVPSRLDLVSDAVFLEGKSDFYILSYYCKILAKKALVLIPSSGANELGPIISLYLGWGKKFAILLDGDTEAKNAKQKYQADWFLAEQKIFLISEAAKDKKITKIEKCLDESDKKLIRDHFGIQSAPSKKHVLRFFQEKLASQEKVPLSTKASSTFEKIIETLEKAIS